MPSFSLFRSANKGKAHYQMKNYKKAADAYAKGGYFLTILADSRILLRLFTMLCRAEGVSQAMCIIGEEETRHNLDFG